MNLQNPQSYAEKLSFSTFLSGAEYRQVEA